VKHRIWKNGVDYWPRWYGACGRCTRWIVTDAWQRTADKLEAHVLDWHKP
jgi:hypothetical protein